MRLGTHVIAKVDSDITARLATLELDLVLSDTPINPNLKVRAFNHLLGESAVTFVAVPELAAKCKGRFPACLDRMPMLLPTDNMDLPKKPGSVV